MLQANQFEQDNFFKENFKYGKKNPLDFLTHSVSEVSKNISVENFLSDAIVINIFNGKIVDDNAQEQLKTFGIELSKKSLPKTFGGTQAIDYVCQQKNIVPINFNLTKNLQKPLLINFVNHCEKNNEAVFVKLNFNCQKNISAKIFQTFHGSENIFSKIFSSHLNCEENSRVELFNLNLSKKNNSFLCEQKINCEKNSLLKTFTFNFGEGFFNSQVSHFLSGQNAETKFFAGDFLSDSAQSHCALHIDHKASHTKSDQTFRGAYYDQSFGSFLGKVKVFHEGHNSDAQQLYKAILLSDDAKAFVRPQLEVYNHDIAASHGATIGQLDDNAIFYLQSRGLDKNKARLLLIESFLLQVIDNIEDKEIKEKFRALTQAKVENALGEFL